MYYKNLFIEKAHNKRNQWKTDMPRLKTPQHYQLIIDRIIASYGGRANLQEGFNVHRRSGNNERLQAFEDYKELCCAEKELESLKQGSVIDRIIASYGGRANLQEGYNVHRRSGNDESRQVFKDYKKLCYAEKKLESLKQGSIQNENASDTDGKEDTIGFDAEEDSHMELEDESSKGSDTNVEGYATDFSC